MFINLYVAWDIKIIKMSKKNCILITAIVSAYETGRLTIKVIYLELVEILLCEYPT